MQLNRLRILSFSSIITALLFASASAIQISVVARLEGKANSDWYGNHVANLGDINNDNYEDFAIASRESGGRIFIYFGSPSFDTVPDLIVKGDSVSNVFTGADVETIGDLNRDGYDDFMVRFGNQQSGVTMVKIFLGSNIPDTVADYIIMDTLPPFSGDWLYLAAGDLDSNGYPDIAIYEYENANGRIHVYLQDSVFNNSARFTFTDGQNLFGAFSMSIADINGDGYADLLTNSLNAGSSYLYFGRDTLANSPDLVLPRYGYHAVGDINADSVSDFGISLGNFAFYYGGLLLDTVPDLAIGASAVGKINRDIYGDIILSGDILGAAGLVRVYLGGNPMDTLKDWDTTIACAPFRGAVTVDINGDGVDEIICPSPTYPCDQNKGLVYIFSSDTTTDVKNGLPSILPRNFTLNQNFPNPFNSSTVITYTLKATSWVNLNIYNIRGERVRQLIDSKMIPGSHSISWDGKDEKGKKVASGIYFARLVTRPHSQTIKLTLLR